MMKFQHKDIATEMSEKITECILAHLRGTPNISRFQGTSNNLLLQLPRTCVKEKINSFQPGQPPPKRRTKQEPTLPRLMTVSNSATIGRTEATNVEATVASQQWNTPRYTVREKINKPPADIQLESERRKQEP